jgi:uncharacterized protein (TIGR03084 family)
VVADVLAGVLSDLADEGDALDAVVAPLDAAAWATPTPADGWTIAHQVGHLLWTDEIALQAAVDADGFLAMAQELVGTGGLTAVDEAAHELAALPAVTLLARWRAGRTGLRAALGAVPQGTRLPWFGPPMSATSMATARLMETWAHGQDVHDALGLVMEPTSRLRHVAHIAVRTLGFSHVINDLPVPTEPVRVELQAPDGTTWSWGPLDATQRVTGPALDFCLLAVQRRHRDDVDVVATGAAADRWLDVIQAFAGAPGPGRAAT